MRSTAPFAVSAAPAEVGHEHRGSRYGNGIYRRTCPFCPMKLYALILLVSSIALAAIGIALRWGMCDCEAPSVLDCSIEKDDVPDEENAYLGYVAAANAVREWPEDGEDTPPELRAALVATNAEALAFMREASARGVWCDTDFQGDGFVGFDFPRMMCMMCMMRWDAEAQIARGDGAAALETIRAIAQLAATMRDGAVGGTYWMCADTAMMSALRLAMEFANAPCATDDGLAELAAFLRSLPDAKSRRSSLCMAARREAYCLGETAFREFLPAHYDNWPIVLRYAFHPNRSWHMYLDVMRRVCCLVERDYDKECWCGLMAEIKSMNAGMKRWLPNFFGREMVVLSLAGWDRTARDEALGEFRAAAAEVVVAAERYRRKHGVRPKSLSALVPEFMPSVPNDPYKVAAQLNYDYARGVVWTVGPDRDFNGEKMPGKQTYGCNVRYVIRLDGVREEDLECDE